MQDLKLLKENIGTKLEDRRIHNDFFKLLHQKHRKQKQNKQQTNEIISN
jgi:hypothetical protein